LLEQLSANPRTVLDHTSAALRLRRRDAISDAQATIDEGSITIEVDLVRSESKRLAPPNTGEEIEGDESTFPTLGRPQLIASICSASYGITSASSWFVREFEIIVLCLPRILEWLHPEQQVFIEQFSDASEVQDLAEDIPRHVLSSRAQRFVDLGLLLVNPYAPAVDVFLTNCRICVLLRKVCYVQIWHAHFCERQF
jgi:hypothetical protein